MDRYGADIVGVLICNPDLAYKTLHVEIGCCLLSISASS